MVMTDKLPKKPISKVRETRDKRLKSALKANLAKRKKQARSRAEANGRDQNGVADANGK